MAVADPTPAALLAESRLHGSLTRAREALEAAEEAVAMFEERSVLEVKVGRCRAEVERLEQEHAELRRQIWGDSR